MGVEIHLTSLSEYNEREFISYHENDNENLAIKENQVGKMTP
jgi:hypothetical protein